MPIRAPALLFAILVGSCAAPSPSAPSASPAAASCAPETDSACIAIEREGTTFVRRLADFAASPVTDGDTQRTAVRLSALIDADIVVQPQAWQFKLFATDGFTHGGFASWSNLEHGFIEVGTRRVFFADGEGLGHSFRVRDTYRIEMTRTDPGGK